MRFFHIHDFVGKDGKTYKQRNLEKKHTIPLESLVELESGVRLFVVEHTRDCDGSLLYTLSPEPFDKEDKEFNDKLRVKMYGYSQEGLTVITVGEVR